MSLVEQHHWRAILEQNTWKKLVCASNTSIHLKLHLLCFSKYDAHHFTKGQKTHHKHLFGVACDKRTLLVQIHQRRGNHFMTNTQKRQWTQKMVDKGIDSWVKIGVHIHESIHSQKGKRLLPQMKHSFPIV